ncbi:MAG: carbon dioxide concentrating mechanism protein CcmL [Planctomycetaceae bacterium]|nr:carbon dioxide concentrating mechanism protein CcmL [Planctomycetaceae bacterium]
MRIGKVVGTVTLSRQHPTLANNRLRIVIPLDLQQLAQGPSVDPWSGDPDDVVIAWDHCSAGLDSVVALAEGPEAAQPFLPELKPIDAGIAALLDDVSIDAAALKKIKNS